MARVIRFFAVLFDGSPWPDSGAYRTDFLVAQPNFMSGVARTLDLTGSFDSYNYSRSSHDADERALSADWQVVGQDLSRVMAEHGRLELQP
jgi:hypothetical protein